MVKNMINEKFISIAYLNEEIKKYDKSFSHKTNIFYILLKRCI